MNLIRNESKSGYKSESSPSAMSCDTAPEEWVDSVDKTIEQLNSANQGLVIEFFLPWGAFSIGA
jgi:hypothetical protein